MMKSVLSWSGEMKFESVASGNAVAMDARAPIGRDSAQTPKELLVSAVAGCTAIDVVSHLKKHRQNLATLQIETEVESTKGVYPAVFTSMLLRFVVTGPVDPKILLESVRLSQTQYCGVSAMLAKAFPIHYIVLLNGIELGRGQADFTSPR